MSTTQATPNRDNPYAHAWAGFARETANHELVVIHDDGLYRHLRVQEPGTRMWSWDVMTWPGHLATSGDIGSGYVFSRTEDMLDFFTVPTHLQGYYRDGAPSIDVRYWAEKLVGVGQYDRVRVFSPEVFLTHVREHLEEHEELGLEAGNHRAQQIALLERIRTMRHRSVGKDTSPTVDEQLAKHFLGRLSAAELFSQDGLSQAEMDILGEEFDLLDLEVDVPRQEPGELCRMILSEARSIHDSFEAAHEWLRENSEIFGDDTWEWDLSGFDLHFLFACYALELTTHLWNQRS